MIDLTKPCKIWTGGINSAGYGVRYVNGKAVLVHRHEYQAHHGDLPDGLLVRHKCDVRACYEIDHLVPGTALDNSRDMVERGRSGVGERNARASLTEQDVLAIRNADRYRGYQKDLAVKYGVTFQQISAIILRKKWQHVQ